MGTVSILVPLITNSKILIILFSFLSSIMSALIMNMVQIEFNVKNNVLSEMYKRTIDLFIDLNIMNERLLPSLQYALKDLSDDLKNGNDINANKCKLRNILSEVMKQNDKNVKESYIIKLKITHIDLSLGNDKIKELYDSYFNDENNLILDSYSLDKLSNEATKLEKNNKKIIDFIIKDFGHIN